MKRSHKIGALLAVLAMVFVSACGNGKDDDSKGSGDKDSYSIGIVHFASADQTSEEAIAAYADYAEKQGWKVTHIDPQGSVDKAINAMNDLVQKKVDLIMVAVFLSDTLTAGVQNAKSAGIPVVSLSGGLADGVIADLDSGYTVGKDVAKLLVEEMNSEGELLVLGYKAGLPCVGREKALTDALKGSKIKVTRKEVPIPGQVEASTQFTEAWLKKNPKGSGNLAVWGCFDDPAVGAVVALRQAERTDVKVYGINGQPNALQEIAKGNMRATFFLDTLKGGTVFAERIPDFIAAGPNAKGELVQIPGMVVKKETLDEFKSEYPDKLK